MNKPSMFTTSRIRRRWSRIALVATIVALITGSWLAYELNWLHQRHELLANGWCGALGNQPPGMLRPFTADGYYKVWKYGGLTQADIQDIDKVKALFPEAEIQQ